MREIKFRAWDKQYKRMYQGKGVLDSISTNGDGRIYYHRKHFNKELKIEIGEPEDFELMQYTGLRDKNGKDIYEGDIIIDYGWGGPVTVIYDDAGFCPFSDGDDGMPYPKPEECSVIGNIHENPELLNGGNHENN